MDDFKKELRKLKTSEFKAEKVTPWHKEQEQEAMLVRSRCGRCGRCGSCARCARCSCSCSCFCSCIGTCFFPCFFPCTSCARCF
ncbi:heterocycloanthracin/sonorensin family bacteriocin [Brevibacillus gelatini]|uniref:heterocycloanthracin/sonorensin family bacteriocin n=1 Tax=Brevibacillus gelatini TaxID=1655277 RepID=UPI003D81BEDA